MVKSVLVDARNIDEQLPIVLSKLASAEVWGLDCETQDEGRHAGLDAYNTKVKHVFDHRRTVMTGFSVFVEGDDTAYYFNLAHADVENRLNQSVVFDVLDGANPDAICVAHNASFEITMFLQCHHRVLQNMVCSMQMAVSHHGPDEYRVDTFSYTPMTQAFQRLVPNILTAFSGYEAGDSLTDDQQELIGKFTAKESKAEHSWNGMWRSIAMGYSLKQLTLSKFGVKQMTYQEVLDSAGAKHMGELTGEQVCSYGADDAYWCVQHYRWMFNDMLTYNPEALRAFFTTENPMVQAYAENWIEGIRLDLAAVFEQRDREREDMAVVLRRFKANLKQMLPFKPDLHPKLVEKLDFYAKRGDAKRKQIESWLLSPDSDDSFTQTFQVSNPIGNAWAIEQKIPVPKSGKLNVVYHEAMRVIMYDLIGLPILYSDGSIASDGDARGKLRERLEKQTDDPQLKLKMDLMMDLQRLSDIEQRMKLYLTPYTQLLDPETGRVYPSLSSLLATRRLAMSFPNPMQLAKLGESAYIRGFYLGDTDEHVVVSADWSAIELVLIGDQSGDEGFRKVYGQLPYGDMHSGAAVDGLSVKTLPGITEEEFREFKFGNNPNGRVLRDFSGTDLSPSNFHKWARGTAIGKGINFSYWYSGALSTVATNLGWSSDQHWEAVDKYRERFTQAEEWRVGVHQTVADQGFVTLPDGHRRTRFEATRQWKQMMASKFADITSAPALLQYGETVCRRIQARAKNQAVNAFIQGTNATLTKRTYLGLQKACEDVGIKFGRGGDVRLMMPIHDEMVFSVHRSVVLQFIPILRRVMETHPDIVKTLPLNCTVAMGRTFRPFNKAAPKLTQVELDEAQLIDGIVGDDLMGTKLSDDKVAELLDWMYL